MALQEPFDLDGKVAMVTGAASGLGIAFCAHIDEDGLGGTDSKVEKTKEEFGWLDILFDKAGCLAK